MPFLKVVKESYTNRMIENSKRNGLRHAIFSPKRKGLFKGYYVGEWKNDVKEGRGKELDRDGWMYDGGWLSDKKHGCGVLSRISKEDGRIRRYYIGEWVAGKKQGFGRNWFEDGSYYEGDFCGNKRHGYGRMWHCTGDYYEGAWKNDLYHGIGMLVKDNGNRYEGQFVRGKKEGYGTFYHIVSGQEQRGFWSNDRFVNGTMSDADFRQSALRSTPYPIPQVRSDNKRSLDRGCLCIYGESAVANGSTMHVTCQSISNIKAGQLVLIFNPFTATRSFDVNPFDTRTTAIVRLMGSQNNVHIAS